MTGERRTGIEVLLIEDSPNDARLVIRALEGAKVRHRVRIATDGPQALALLRRRPPHQDEQLPNLILLDLNLPKIDGRALLGTIKHDPDLRGIPIIVLTGSDEPRDVAESYRLHANAVVGKPVEPASFATVINSIERFWLEIVKLP
jgi:CheY-like chemotaxis protein